MKGKKDTLVAILKDRGDYYYADVEHWYRIPKRKKIVPVMVKKEEVKYIAFYLPKTFGKNAYTIQWFAEVKNISIHKRKELVIDDEKNRAANEDYYKLEIGDLIDLTYPIKSLRKRRIIFIKTTKEHLDNAKEINDLFFIDDSPAEEQLWSVFKKQNIKAERQFEITIPRKKFIVDFALLCKNKKIAIECDSKKFHDRKKDEIRDKLIGSDGWETIHFKYHDIFERMGDTLNIIRDKVNYFGGYEAPDKPGKFEYISSFDEKQFLLFDKHEK